MNDAEQLQQQIKNNMISSAPAFDELNTFNLPDIFEEAQSQLDEAITFDQNKQHKDALNKYKFASQLFLDGMRQSNNTQEKIKYRNKVNTIVGRCEILHSLIQKQKEELAKQKRVNSGVANEPLTDKEIRVLRASSFIRNLELVPWMDMDNNMRINNNDSFKDCDGLLPLSQKQQNKFGKWKRTKNICKGRISPKNTSNVAFHTTEKSNSSNEFSQ